MEKESLFSIARNFENSYTTGESIFEKSKYDYTKINQNFGKAYDFSGKEVAWFIKQKSFYKEYLQPNIVGAPLAKAFREEEKKREFTETLYAKVGWHNIKEPDGCIYNVTKNELYIIEVKYQNGVGSVHEKLLGAPGLKWLYEQAANKLNNPKPKVTLLYIVNNYLYQHYPDDFNFLDSENIDYFIEEFPPLSYFNL